jgi:glutamate/tyrosine decarboxylase-like PLP-dependent enzyme
VEIVQEKKRLMEETLDPEDWESMRALGHRMLDDMLEYLKTVQDRPVWQPIPEDVKQKFRMPHPVDPQKPEEIYKEFSDFILPYPLGNIHPRFWGWVAGTGTVSGMLADMLAAGMNSNLAGADHVANYVEKQVIDWLIEMLGFPASASGLLTSGCSAANLIGLTVARNSKAEYNLRREGIQDAPQKMVLYSSQETHSSIQKAVELLGLGSNSLRILPLNDNFQIDLDVLKETIAQDRHQGFLPFCIIGTAGSTNTGMVDDLNALADICQQENLWYHIDGAFGAWAALAPEANKLVVGMERADSLAVDLHKWIYLPYEIGAILVRSEECHRNSFSLTPAYLSHGEDERGMTGGTLPWFSDYGFQLSRGFKALKAWMAFKEYGSRKFGRLIQQNIDQAGYLAALIDSSPELELAAPVHLNVVCFRYIKPGLNGIELDKINEQILAELQEQGIAVPSSTMINGNFVLHVAHTNHRSRREDFDILVRAVIRIGEEIIQSNEAA